MHRHHQEGQAKITSGMKFNTAIAAMMTLVNTDLSPRAASRAASWKRMLVQLLNPVAPHITEEMWQNIGHEKSIALSAAWPEFDENKTIKAEV